MNRLDLPTAGEETEGPPRPRSPSRPSTAARAWGITWIVGLRDFGQVPSHLWASVSPSARKADVRMYKYDLSGPLPV